MASKQGQSLMRSQESIFPLPFLSGLKSRCPWIRAEAVPAKLGKIH